MEGNESAILKAAEEMVRQGGYNAFSFRSIADAVGIKSSSVHYYFPTKEDLGVAVARYYTHRFIESLGDPQAIFDSGKNPIKAYVKAFRSALVNDRRMCLCGILGAEADGLPEPVVAETRVFFERNIEWLTIAYSAADKKRTAHKRAIQTLSLLEGAMLASNVLGDIKVFDQAAELILS
ncbi:MAG: TetR/AcrR family transcriptional regulator [Myxococcota bacterium]